MKSLKELEEIRQKTLNSISMRKDNDNIRVVVGMATCGIAAGARPVLLAFMDEIAKRGLNNVSVSQTGCIGVCRLDPLWKYFIRAKKKLLMLKSSPTWYQK